MQPARTRILRPEYSGVHPLAGAGAPAATPGARIGNGMNSANGNGHRLVFGRGAHRTAAGAPAAVHVSGARMNVIRKDSGRPMKRGRPGPAKALTAMPNAREGDKIPPLPPDAIRIVPMGGVEEIGRNCTAIQFGDDIVIVDVGFQFKDENTPGIDYILPNTKYVEERREKIRAIIITHGHLDHTGAIPYIMPRIGNPPIYTRLLTSVLIQKRQEEFPHLPKLDIHLVEQNTTITLGKLKVKFFSVTHTIPDAMGVIIETPYGSIVHTGDLKMDHDGGIPTPEEDAEYDRAFKAEKVLMLMADSTNVEIPGFSTPERQVHKNLE